MKDHSTSRLKYLYELSSYKTVSNLKKLNFIISAVTKETLRQGEKRLYIYECGCGRGNIAGPLATLRHYVLATDTDLFSVLDAKRHFFSHALHFAQADINHIPTAKRFQVIVCSEVLEHLEYPQKALDSIRSALSDNGLLILTLPNGYGPWELREAMRKITKRVLHRLKLFKLAKSLFCTGQKRSKFDCSTLNPSTPHLQRFTMKNIKKMLEKSRFRIGCVRHSDFLVPALPLLWRLQPFVKLDCRIADWLPDWAVSGWYVTARAVPEYHLGGHQRKFEK